MTEKWPVGTPATACFCGCCPHQPQKKATTSFFRAAEVGVSTNRKRKQQFNFFFESSRDTRSILPMFSMFLCGSNQL